MDPIDPPLLPKNDLDHIFIDVFKDKTKAPIVEKQLRELLQAIPYQSPSVRAKAAASPARHVPEAGRAE
jgi:hypothetical protein